MTVDTEKYLEFVEGVTSAPRTLTILFLLLVLVSWK